MMKNEKIIISGPPGAGKTTIIKKLKLKGYFVHDEIQLTVKEEYADRIGEICTQAIVITGDRYGLRIPLTGEYKVGTNWAETH